MGARRSVLVLLTTLALGGCGDDLTEIFFCYDADPSLFTSGERLRISARSYDGARILFDSELDPGDSLPAGQGFVQERLDGVHVQLEVTSPTPRPFPLVQAARVRFQPGRIVDVSLRAEVACDGLGCGADETCVEGICQPIVIPARCLPDHGMLGPADCDARTARGCPAEAVAEMR